MHLHLSKKQLVSNRHAFYTPTQNHEREKTQKGHHRFLKKITGEGRRASEPTRRKKRGSAVLLAVFFPLSPRPKKTRTTTAGLLELRVPEARHLDVLGHLGAQVRVGRLDRLEHAGDLARGGVDLYCDCLFFCFFGFVGFVFGCCFCMLWGSVLRVGVSRARVLGRGAL